MLDWYGGLLGFDGRGLRPDTVVRLTPDGDIVWNSQASIEAVGSYDASIQLRPWSATPGMLTAAERLGLLCNTTLLRVSGNPTKFLQGHNVFGPSVAALAPVMQAAVRGLPSELRPVDADSPLWPAVHRNRVDITTSVDLGNHQLVHEWLRTAEQNTRSRHGRAMRSGDTVYWGKNSTRWSLKAYCKYCELEAHPPKLDIESIKELREYCYGHLRLELTLRTPELKDRGTLEEALIWEFMGRIQVGVMSKEALNSKTAFDLPPIVLFTLTRWRGGEDVRQSLTRPTFYRHRKLILDKVGVDISLPTDEKAIERINFDVPYLKAHEVKEVPQTMQGRLFKPGPFPRWSAKGKEG